nr:MAG: hypothetical protein [brine shrimp arlivirus 9]
MEGQKIPNHIPTPATESIRLAIDDLEAAMQQDAEEHPQQKIITSTEALSVNSTPPYVKGLFNQALGYFSGSAARKPSITGLFAQAHSAPVQNLQNSEKRVRFSEGEMSASPPMRAPSHDRKVQVVDEGDEIIFHHTPEGKPVTPQSDPIANLQERLLSRSNLGADIPEEIIPVESVKALATDMASFNIQAVSDQSTRVGDGLDSTDEEDTDEDHESLSDLKEKQPLLQKQAAEIAGDIEDFTTPIASPSDEIPDTGAGDEYPPEIQYLYWICKGQEELTAKVNDLNAKFDAITSKQNEALNVILQNQKLILDTIKQDWAAPVKHYDNLKHTINEMDQKISALRTEVKATCGGLPKIESQLGDISRMLASFEINMIRNQIISIGSEGGARTTGYLHTPDERSQLDSESQQSVSAPGTSGIASSAVLSGLTPLPTAHSASLQVAAKPAVAPQKIKSADIVKVLGDPLVPGKPSTIFRAWARSETNHDLKQLFPKVSLRMEKALKAERAKRDNQDYTRFFLQQ